MLQEVGVHKHLFSPDFIKYSSELHLCHVELRLCTDSGVEESEVGEGGRASCRLHSVCSKHYAVKF